MPRSDNSGEYPGDSFEGTSLAEDSEVFRSWWRRLNHGAKLAASIGTILALFAAPVGSVLWIITTVRDAQAQTVQRVERMIETRVMHVDAVPREVYVEHVRQMDMAVEKAEQRDHDILRKLDLLGEQVYRSRGHWRARLADEGMAEDSAALAE